MVLVLMLMKIGSPTKEESLVMTLASISPPEGKFPPQNQTVGEKKGTCLGFCLETTTLRTESNLLIFFSRVKHTMYEKMDVGGPAGAPQAIRAHPRGCPIGLCPAGGPSPVYFWPRNSQIYQNKSP